MEHHDTHQPDYGTGEKKLGVYLFGLISCSILTLLSFWVVMANQFTKGQVFATIYVSACVQFLMQVICFLRLNTQTEQGRLNVMAIAFTVVVLITIIIGSLWIIGNLNYQMLK